MIEGYTCANSRNSMYNDHFIHPIKKEFQFWFLAHLSWKLKWAFLIACHPSSEIAKIHLQNFNQKKHTSISTKLATMHPWVKGHQVCSNEGPCPFPSGDYYEIAKNILTNFKNLLLQNHWANFNQSWHKAFDSSLFKWRAPNFPRGDN